MRWHIYTKLVPIDGGMGLRWFWRNPATSVESSHGFLSRAECEENACASGFARSDAAQDAPWEYHFGGFSKSALSPDTGGHDVSGRRTTVGRRHSDA